jgi:predicted AAA+ superfamily ATPase
MNLSEKSLEMLSQNNISRPFYVEKLSNMVSVRNVVVITGQRRSGKSTVILDFLRKENIDSSKIFYLNKELDSLSEIPDNIALERLFDQIAERNPNIEYVIIDEIQDIISWEKFVRARFAEKKYKIVITGSNSKLLS